jgi:hypothetical protein
MKVLKVLDDCLNTVSSRLPPFLGCSLLYIFDARHLAGGASAHAHRILQGVQYSWALHHASALPSLQIGSTWNSVPSCTVACDRVCNVAKCLRLVSSCQKQRDNIGSCLFLAGDNVLMFCKILALEWRVRKQRRQSGLRPRVPARSSTRRLSNSFRAGAEIILPVAFISAVAQPLGLSTVTRASCRHSLRPPIRVKKFGEKSGDLPSAAGSRFRGTKR